MRWTTVQQMFLNRCDLHIHRISTWRITRFLGNSSFSPLYLKTKQENPTYRALKSTLAEACHCFYYKFCNVLLNCTLTDFQTEQIVQSSNDLDSSSRFKLGFFKVASRKPNSSFMWNSRNWNQTHSTLLSQALKYWNYNITKKLSLRSKKDHLLWL